MFCMYHLILFTPFPFLLNFFAQPPIFPSFAPKIISPPPLKIFLHPNNFYTSPKNFFTSQIFLDPPSFLLRSLSNSPFLSPSKKWGCKPKKVGGVNTQNTPASAPLIIIIYIIVYNVYCICTVAPDKYVQFTSLYGAMLNKQAKYTREKSSAKNVSLFLDTVIVVLIPVFHFSFVSFRYRLNRSS